MMGSWVKLPMTGGKKDSKKARRHFVGQLVHNHKQLEEIYCTLYLECEAPRDFITEVEDKILEIAVRLKKPRPLLNMSVTNKEKGRKVVSRLLIIGLHEV